ncbi:MAG: hypothetical protein ACJAV5_001293 [Vicingaceae bacterium]
MWLAKPTGQCRIKKAKPSLKAKRNVIALLLDTYNKLHLQKILKSIISLAK